jgi:hypothetical protein
MQRATVDLSDVRAGAIFSKCRTYRYSLWREWDAERGHVLFVALNPSTADERHDDPTIRRCIGFARDWGYGGVYVANLFAFRATQTSDLLAASAPIGPANDRHLRRLVTQARIVVAAWGVHGCHLGRDAVVARALPSLHCLSTTRAGFPAHPLYQPRTRIPVPWSPPVRRCYADDDRGRETRTVPATNVRRSDRRG